VLVDESHEVCELDMDQSFLINWESMHLSWKKNVIYCANVVKDKKVKLSL
jgi:hypothetical protein